MRRLLFAGFGATALLTLAPLASCGRSDDSGQPGAAAETSSGTLAAAIDDAPGLTTASGALKSTGLASVFDGTAPYTLLAPTDDAFGALGDAGAALRTPENAAAMAAILKQHILPGAVAVADIDAALTAAKGKPVKMKTMAGGEVSFARAGDELTITAPDGATAKIDGAPLQASNGVALPIDAVLKKFTVPTTG